MLKVEITQFTGTPADLEAIIERKNNELEAKIERKNNELLKQIQVLLNNFPNFQGTEKPRNLEEAAAFLNIAPTTLYGLTSRREISFVKTGRKLMFFEADLQGFLDKGKYKTKAAIEAESLTELTTLNPQPRRLPQQQRAAAAM